MSNFVSQHSTISNQNYKLIKSGSECLNVINTSLRKISSNLVKFGKNLAKVQQNLRQLENLNRLNLEGQPIVSKGLMTLSEGLEKWTLNFEDIANGLKQSLSPLVDRLSNDLAIGKDVEYLL